jgi:Mn2+/Fe2+ NRAMP family transporter
MGAHVNRAATTAVAAGIAAFVTALNVFLLAQTVGLA